MRNTGRLVAVDGPEEPSFKRNGKPALTPAIGGWTQATIRKGVDWRVHRDRINATRRAAMGRYVGVFGFPGGAHA